MLLGFYYRVEGDGKRHIVQSDKLLSAFLELELTLLFKLLSRAALDQPVLKFKTKVGLAG